MWKKYLGKLPRKPSKSDFEGDPTSSSCDGNGENACSAIGNGLSSRSASTLKRMSAVFPSSVVAGIEPLLSFKDVPSQERQNLFVSKLSLCCVVFDFSDSTKNTAEKELKRQTLVELVKFVSTGNTRFNDQVIVASCQMFMVNLFRVFPPIRRPSSGGENDEDEPAFEPAWSHLQVIYELLLKFIASSSLDAKIAKKYFDHSFVTRLLDLFDSEDPRERDCVKTILHRIYGKFMVHRPLIRKAIGNIVHRFVFETEKHNGIGELLEVLGSVISGFALPLKEEHKMFLWRTLIPLHKAKSLGGYFQQLTFCISQFIEKEPKLASTVIMGLLKYWPVTSSQKEVMFLSELEEILETTDALEFQTIMVPAFQRVARCLTSSHFQAKYLHRCIGRAEHQLLQLQLLATPSSQAAGAIAFLLLLPSPCRSSYYYCSSWKSRTSTITDPACLMKKKGEIRRQNTCTVVLGELNISFCSYNYQVAERAHYLWNNDQIVEMIAQNRQVIMPIMLPALERNTRSHWNSSVLGLSLNIKKMLAEMDQELFLDCQENFKEEEAQLAASVEKRRMTWERLEAVAASKPVSEKTAVLVTPLFQLV